MTEEEMLKQIRTLDHLSNLTQTPQMTAFDAFNDTFVVEVKSRGNKQYDDTIIEKKKFDSCISLGKTFLYVVHCKDKLYIFNITDLVLKDYDFRWEDKNQPATTAFSNNNWVLKNIGYLVWSDAETVLNRTP